MMRVAYLGPTGSFSEEAAMTYLAGCAETKREELLKQILPCKSLGDVFQQVESGQAEIGVVPVENSCEGTVYQALDLMAGKANLAVVGELLLPIEQHLLVRNGVELADIKRILSHAQAIGQCQFYLEANLPRADIENTRSTAQAAEIVAASSEPCAAIGSARAAEQFNLQILSKAINDQKDNTTRFWVISPFLEENNVKASSVDIYKTSLVVGGPDRPGALYTILREFALRGLNLTRIESRPDKGRPGCHLFFIDLMGHGQNQQVHKSLEAISSKGFEVRMLGSYPSAVGTAPCHQTESSRQEQNEQLLQSLREQINNIDGQIAQLLGERTRVVEQIGRTKGNHRQVVDPQREEEVIARVRLLAEKEGFDPLLMEDIYRKLIGHFVELQIQMNQKK